MPKITIYYCTRRDLNTCIVYGGNHRFFLSIRDCVLWAAREGLIKDAEKVIQAAEAEANFLERLDDQKWNEADSQFRLNQSIADAGGDVGEVARLLRRFRDRFF